MADDDSFTCTRCGQAPDNCKCVYQVVTPQSEDAKNWTWPKPNGKKEVRRG